LLHVSAHLVWHQQYDNCLRWVINNVKCFYIWFFPQDPLILSLICVFQLIFCKQNLPLCSNIHTNQTSDLWGKTSDCWRVGCSVKAAAASPAMFVYSVASIATPWCSRDICSSYPDLFLVLRHLTPSARSSRASLPPCAHRLSLCCVTIPS